MTLPEDTILIDRYRIDDLLAHGGMGAIYRAFDTQLNTPVAIKENFFQIPERVTQFKKEALVLARLRHPALPKVIHHFSFEGQQYLVMDLVDGENLWQWIKRRGEPLPERSALDYAIQICQAVNYLHRQSPPVFHRDIKPQNIKITSNNRAKLVDIGIARLFVNPQNQAETGALSATAGFSPPEQYTGERDAGPASDIYSLGATLYAVLTGQRPPVSISLAEGSVTLQPPHQVNPKVSRPLAEAVLQAMQLDPEKRPHSVLEWQKQLETIFNNTSPLSPTDATVPAPRSPTHRKKLRSSQILRQSVMGGALWLVDARGVGYPMAAGSLLQIGRHSEADIIVEDVNVSRFHAQIKVDGNRCFILDEGSSNGTFLNGHQLGPEWYPLQRGDVLMIGPARFHITSTEPARLAAAKAAAGAGTPPVPVPVNIPRQKTTTEKMAPLAASGSVPTWAGGMSPPALLAVVILLLLVGIGGFAWFNPNTFNRAPKESVAAAESPATATDVEKATQTALPATEAVIQPLLPPASPVTEAAPAAVDAALKVTAPVTQTPTAVAGGLPAATATPKPIPSKTPTATLLPKQKTPVALVTAQAAVTVTVTVTATETRPAVRPVPVVTEPTIIPMQSSESVPALGSVEVIDVDINPENPKEVYALVKHDGIYKSSNGGDGPWARVDLDGSAITGLAIDPENPLELYAPTWNAVLKSTDGGSTWDPKINGLVSNQAVETLTFNPSNTDILYAGIGETLVVSSDEGENWSSLGYGDGLGASRLFAILIDPFNSNVVYVAGLAGSIYRSENKGQDFIQLPINVGEGTFGMAAHPTQPNVILAGINSAAAGIIKSEDGIKFRSVSGGLVYGGADSAYSAITFAPGNPKIVYAGSGFERESHAKGIFKSIDGGETWNSQNNGLAINPETGYPHYVKSIAVHPILPNVVFAATGSGLYKSTDGGENWELK